MASGSQSPSHNSSHIPPRSNSNSSSSGSSSSSGESSSSAHTLVSVPTKSQSVVRPSSQPVPEKKLLKRSKYLPLRDNNHQLDAKNISVHHPIIIEILKGHPLFFLLLYCPKCPLIYLQQFWHSIHYVPELDNHHFKAKIDCFKCSINLPRFRRALYLPKRRDPVNFSDKLNYDEFVSEDQLCADIVRLRYSAPLPKASSFK